MFQLSQSRKQCLVTGLVLICALALSPRPVSAETLLDRIVNYFTEDAPTDAGFDVDESGFEADVENTLVPQEEDQSIPGIKDRQKFPVRKSTPLGQQGEIGLAISISTCREIAEPGRYTLTTNISSPVVPSIGIYTACLFIHDTQDVDIDCAQHSITTIGKKFQIPILMSNVRNFSIKGCSLDSQGALSALDVRNSSNGKISDTTFRSPQVYVVDGIGLTLTRNTFDKASYRQSFTNGSRIERNVFDLRSSFGKAASTDGAIVSLLGADNTISHNTINGGSDGLFPTFSSAVGADDGIIIEGESQDIVSDNTIEDVWDCGIETFGLISNTKMLNNTVKNAGVCGIGAWYWNSWKGNTITGNTVEDAPILFYIFRDYGIRPERDFRGKTIPADGPVFFKDNVFSGNTLLVATKAKGGFFRPVSADINMSRTRSSLPLERAPVAADFILGNNVFTNNDFGTTLAAPRLFPFAMVVDGGGNICGKTVDANYPLKCVPERAVSPSAPTLRANDSDGPLAISFGDKVMLAWTLPSTATTCTGNWIQNAIDVKSKTDTLVVTPRFPSTVYTISCLDASGKSIGSDSVEIRTEDYAGQAPVQPIPPPLLGSDGKPLPVRKGVTSDTSRSSSFFSKLKDFFTGGEGEPFVDDTTDDSADTEGFEAEGEAEELSAPSAPLRPAVAENKSPYIISVVSPAPVLAGKDSVWNISVADPDGAKLLLSVDWGDGSAISSISTKAEKDGATAIVSLSHLFNKAGSYRAAFTVNDGEGGEDTLRQTVTVTSSAAHTIAPQPPTGNTGTGNVAAPSSPAPTKTLETGNIGVPSIGSGNIGAPSALSVDLKIDGKDRSLAIPEGSYITPDYTSRGATYCTTSWNNDRSVSNPGETIGPITQDGKYRVTCYSASGASVFDEVRVGVYEK